jgi:hypothetical protein
MIYVECDSDKALVKALSIPKKKITCARGKGRVCNRLVKYKNSLGLVDEDPGHPEPHYIRKLRIILDKDEIRLLYDESNQNHLIILCPELEKWILETTKEVGENITKYNLSDDLGELYKRIIIRPEKLENLVKDIKNKSKRLKTLEELLKKFA